jgi:alkylated DNA repair dioxygenase AlkB
MTMLLPGILNLEENLLPKDGRLVHRPGFLGAEQAESILRQLLSETPWKSDKILMYGKVHDLPRLTAWYGDEGKTYTYSNIKLAPLAWTATLLNIRHQVEAHTGKKFNSVLLNLYRSGSDHVSWHADNEFEFGERPTIVSLSLGETRKFQLKHRYDLKLPMLSLPLEAGALVIMEGAIQECWLHRIAPSKKILGPRINLTFRCIK